MKTSPKECAGALIEAVPAVMRVIRQHMRSHRLPGMSVPQFRALAFLNRYGTATLSVVAEHVGTNLPSMSRMVQSLVEGQLIQRRAGSPDRRTICLQITAKGRRVLDVARKATVQQLAGLLEPLAAEELDRLDEAMSLLVRVFSAGNSPCRQQDKVH